MFSLFQNVIKWQSSPGQHVSISVKTTYLHHLLSLNEEPIAQFVSVLLLNCLEQPMGLPNLFLASLPTTTNQRN